MIYQKLNNSLALQKLVTGIYTHVPSDTKFPYIVISRIEHQNYSTKTNKLLKVNHYINIFHRLKNFESILLIAQLIDNLLNNKPYDLMDHYKLVQILLKDQQVFQASDGITTIGNLKYQSLISGE